MGEGRVGSRGWEKVERDIGMERGGLAAGSYSNIVSGLPHHVGVKLSSLHESLIILHVSFPRTISTQRTINPHMWYTTP